MNWAIIILLGVLVVFCNATADEIRFHWDRFFGLVIKADSWADHWFNPVKSWTNKYIPKSRFWRFVFGDILVFMTDFWHFLKSVAINAVWCGILLIVHTTEVWWKWLIMLCVLNFFWWFVFKSVTALWGGLSDLVRKDLHK